MAILVLYIIRPPAKWAWNQIRICPENFLYTPCIQALSFHKCWKFDNYRHFQVPDGLSKLHICGVTSSNSSWNVLNIYDPNTKYLPKFLSYVFRILWQVHLCWGRGLPRTYLPTPFSQYVWYAHQNWGKQCDGGAKNSYD